MAIDGRDRRHGPGEVGVSLLVALIWKRFRCSQRRHYAESSDCILDGISRLGSQRPSTLDISCTVERSRWFKKLRCCLQPLSCGKIWLGEAWSFHCKSSWTRLSTADSMFLASPTFTLHMIVHVDPWLCPPAVVVVFAATFAMSSNTSCINSPVTAEHSA
jgi:hypothetical protein